MPLTKALTTVLLSVSICAGSSFAAQASNQKLVLAWENAPRSIDPRYSIDANSQYLEDLLNCSLVNFDETGATTNYLAKSIEWKSPTELSVKIKPGIKFSDGETVKTADVVATFQFFLDEKISPPSPRASAFKPVESVTSGKKGEIIFKLKEPDATFVTNLIVGILPAKFAKMAGPLTMEQGVSGCGPYVLKQQSLTTLNLQSNPHYNLSDKAKTSSIEIKIVKDETTRFAKLRRGEVDIIQNIVSRDKVSQVGKKYPSLTIKRKPALKTSYIGFNMKDPILAKPEVRRAIALAIDREPIIKYILNGLAIPAKTMLTPQDPFISQKVKSISYNPSKAKKILDDLGLKSKPRFKLSLKTTQNTTRIAVAKAIASQLAKIGIKVTVQPLEWGRFKADVEQGKVQMWTLAWIGFKDPDIFRYAFSTKSFTPNGGNRGRYSNEKLDKLLDQGKQATVLKERQEIYEQVQEIVAKDLPYIFLWHEENFAIINKKVQGFEIYADGRFSALRNTFKK